MANTQEIHDRYKLHTIGMLQKYRILANNPIWEVMLTESILTQFGQFVQRLNEHLGGTITNMHPAMQKLMNLNDSNTNPTFEEIFSTDATKAHEFFESYLKIYRMQSNK